MLRYLSPISTAWERKLYSAAVLAGQAKGAVTLTPTPSSLTFTYQLGSKAFSAPETVSVKVSSGNLAYTTSTDTA